MQLLAGPRREPSAPARTDLTDRKEHDVYVPADYNAQIIDQFHANEGRVGGVWEETPMLLLHHTGAKSGRSRVNPLPT